MCWVHPFQCRVYAQNSSSFLFSMIHDSTVLIIMVIMNTACYWCCTSYMLILAPLLLSVTVAALHVQACSA